MMVLGCNLPETAGCAGAVLPLSVKNADDVFKMAVDAGYTVKMPVSDMFWGDRFGCVNDPFNYTWAVSTH